MFGEDKLLPRDLLSAEPQPFYNFDDNIAANINQFELVHSRVTDYMQTYNGDLRKQQHKIYKKVDYHVGNLVTAKLHVPVASTNKFSTKFIGPYRIVDKTGGNKYKIQNLKTLDFTNRHADDPKKVSMEADLTASELGTKNEEIDPQIESDSEGNDVIDDTDETHEYTKKLTSHT